MLQLFSRTPYAPVTSTEPLVERNLKMAAPIWRRNDITLISAHNRAAGVGARFGLECLKSCAKITNISQFAFASSVQVVTIVLSCLKSTSPFELHRSLKFDLNPEIFNKHRICGTTCPKEFQFCLVLTGATS